MQVAVKKHIQIPHSITVFGKELFFNPQADVPEEIGKKIVANKPDMYFEVKEGDVVDPSEYTVKDVFQGKTVEEIFNMLPQKDRVEIYNLLRKRAKAAQLKEGKKQQEEYQKIVDAQKAPDALQRVLGVDDSEKESTETKPTIKKVK